MADSTPHFSYRPDPPELPACTVPGCGNPQSKSPGGLCFDHGMLVFDFNGWLRGLGQTHFDTDRAAPPGTNSFVPAGHFVGVMSSTCRMKSSAHSLRRIRLACMWWLSPHRSATNRTDSGVGSVSSAE